MPQARYYSSVSGKKKSCRDLKPENVVFEVEGVEGTVKALLEVSKLSFASPEDTVAASGMEIPLREVTISIRGEIVTS